MSHRHGRRYLEFWSGLVLAALVVVALAGLGGLGASTPIADAAQRPVPVGSMSVPRPLDSDQSSCEDTLAQSRTDHTPTDNFIKICRALVSLGNTVGSAQVATMAKCARSFIEGTNNGNPEIGATLKSCGTTPCLNYVRPIVQENNVLRDFPPKPPATTPDTRKVTSNDIQDLCQDFITTAAAQDASRLGAMVQCAGTTFKKDIAGKDWSKILADCKTNSTGCPTGGVVPDWLRRLADTASPQSCPTGTTAGTGSCSQWNVTGTWNMTNGRYSGIVLNLQQSGTTITGTAKPDPSQGLSSTSVPVTGSVSGSSIDLVLPWDPSTGNPTAPSHFTGKIEQTQIIDTNSFFRWQASGSASCASGSSTSNSSSAGSSGSSGASSSTSSSGSTSSGFSGPSSGGSTTTGSSGGSTTSSSSSSSGGDSGCFDLFGIQICIGP